MGSWAVSTFWPLCLVLLLTWVLVYLSEYLLSFFWVNTCEWDCINLDFQDEDVDDTYLTTELNPIVVWSKVKQIILAEKKKVLVGLGINYFIFVFFWNLIHQSN